MWDTREYLSGIVSRFFSGKAPAVIERYGTGHINDTYKIDFPEESNGFLLQRINTGVFKEPAAVMNNIQEVYRHLAKIPGHRCLLRPVTDATGALFYESESGECWRCFPFFPNTYSPSAVENAEQAHKGAQVIGRFLNDLLSLDPRRLSETIPHFHNSEKRFLHFLELLKSDPAGRLSSARKEVEYLLEQQHVFSKVAELNLPSRVVHNDTKIGNVLFDRFSGEAQCLIDWDTIMPGILLSDFGDMVRSFTPPVDENEEDLSLVGVDMDIFQALCKGFLPELAANLTTVEVENMVLGARWITLEQALRFLADHLAGDPYYKIDFPGQNLTRAKNQLALFHSMRENRRQMEKVFYDSLS